MAELTCGNCLEALNSAEMFDVSTVKPTLYYHPVKNWLLCHECYQYWGNLPDFGLIRLIRPTQVSTAPTANPAENPGYTTDQVQQFNQITSLRHQIRSLMSQLTHLFAKVNFLVKTNQLVSLLPLPPETYYQALHKELQLAADTVGTAASLLRANYDFDVSTIILPKLNLRLKRGTVKFYLDDDNFAQLFLYHLDPKNVSFERLAKNPNLTMSDIRDYLESNGNRAIRLSWSDIVFNPNFDLGFYLSHWAEPAHYPRVTEPLIRTRLCQNSSLDEISSHPDIHWGVEVSSNPYLTIEFILNQPELQWDIDLILNNPAIFMADVVKYQVQLQQRFQLDWSKVRLTRPDLSWSYLETNYPEIATQVAESTKRLWQNNLVLTNYVTIQDLLANLDCNWDFENLFYGLDWDLTQLQLLIDYVDQGGDFNRPNYLRHDLESRLNGTTLSWSEWLWTRLSRCQQPKILELVLQNLDKPWDHQTLSYHPGVDQAFYTRVNSQIPVEILAYRARVTVKNLTEEQRHLNWFKSALHCSSTILRERLYMNEDQDIIKRTKSWFQDLNRYPQALRVADLVKFRDLPWDWCHLSGAKLGIE